MKIAKLNIEGYIGELDPESQFKGEKSFSLNNLRTFLKGLDSDVTDIHYTVNSGGGKVFEGWDIRDELIASGKKLHSLGENIVGSIATVIYMAAKLENREIVKGTDFFIHHPYWLPGESEPVRADELLALGKDLKEEQDKLLNFYAKESKATAEQLFPLMAKETSLTSDEAVLFGFASKVIESEDFVSYHKYRLAAFIDIKDKTNQNKINMENKNEILAAINKMGTMLAKVFKGTIVNMDIAATDASGNAVNLQIDTDTEDLVGKFAFLIDADGNRTEAPDGDYVDGSGRTVAIAGGKVTEVATKEEESTEPMDAIKAELETVKAELEAKKAEVLAAQTEATEIKASLETINTEFVALKKVVIGAGAKFETEGQNFNNAKQVEKPVSAFDHVAERLKRK